LYSPWHDPSRVYYGTDTRAAAPLIGALAAIALRPWRWGLDGAQPNRVRGWLRDAAGLGALIGLGMLMRGYSDTAPALYRGGFLLVAAVSAVLVAVAAHPASRVGAAL